MSSPETETASDVGSPAGSNFKQKRPITHNTNSFEYKAENIIASDNHLLGLEYARAAIPVFPCSAALNKKKLDQTGYATPLKSPLVGGNWLTTATTDVETIDRWWFDHPDALVGLPCKPHNLLVIDADHHGDGADGVSAFQSLIDQHGGLPPNTVIVETQSGGKHYIFRQPEGMSLDNGEGRLPKGVNVRGIGQGDGGYIIAPKTIWLDPEGSARGWDHELDSPELLDAISLGLLATVPEWIIELLAPKKTETAKEPSNYIDDPEAERRYIGEALSFINADARDVWLRVGGALHHSGHSWARSEWDRWSQTSVSYDAQDQQKTWEGFGSHANPSTVGSIIELARQSGFDGRKFEGTTLAGSPDSFELEDVWFHGDKVPEPVPTIIDDLLPARGVSYLGGQSGAGKSLIALDITVALASNQKFIGRDTEEKLGVIYIAAEGADTISSRLSAAVSGRELDDQKLPIAVFDRIGDLSDKTELDRTCSRLLAVSSRISERFGVRVGLVILDTLASAFSVKEENSAAEMNKVIKQAARLGEAIGAATLVVHHYGKDQATGLRGSSAIKGRGESTIAVFADRNELTGKCTNRRVTHTKNRIGEEGATVQFHLEHVPLGVDRKGRTFGAAKVIFAESDGKKDVTTKPLTKGQKTLKVAMEQALESSGLERRLSHDGPLVKVVEREQVRKIFNELWATDSDDPEKKADARRKAFKRACDDCEALGFVRYQEIDGIDLLWFPNQQEFLK